MMTKKTVNFLVQFRGVADKTAYQISTSYLNARPRYYYFQFLKANNRHIVILLLVSILSFSLSSACDSALAY